MDAAIIVRDAVLLQGDDLAVLFHQHVILLGDRALEYLGFCHQSSIPCVFFFDDSPREADLHLRVRFEDLAIRPDLALSDTCHSLLDVVRHPVMMTVLLGPVRLDHLEHTCIQCTTDVAVHLVGPIVRLQSKHIGQLVNIHIFTAVWHRDLAEIDAQDILDRRSLHPGCERETERHIAVVLFVAQVALAEMVSDAELHDVGRELLGMVDASLNILCRHANTDVKVGGVVGEC